MNSNLKNLPDLEEELTFKVDKHFNSKRLDQFLSEVYPEYSRNYYQNLIKEGLVFSEKKPIKKPSKKIKEGEEYTVLIPKPQNLEIKPEKIPLDILYEDEDIAVVFKPAGMVVHPSVGHTSKTLVNALLHHFKNVSQYGGKNRAGIVHRLDKDTAGLLITAKTEFAHKELQKQFQNKEVDKRYKTIVTGKPKQHEIIDLPIGRSIFNRKKMGTTSTNLRDAITEYWLENYDSKSNISLVDIKLYTGRTHQIRVHMSSIGHPILNDRTYGFKLSSVKDPKIREFLKTVPYHYLIAYKIGFSHPRTKQYIEVELDKFPEYFNVVQNILKGRDNALKQSRED
ncbi:MAG: RluA family pseudouridine synthase [Aquificae bacterium]|nr:RluA family pseudouridine synthase [Aquificota bacterium]